VYQRFIVNPPPETRIRFINYDENPFISDTIRKVIDSVRLEDQEEYDHVYMGVPKADDESAVIKRSWLEAAIDAHIKLDLDLSGACTVGYDVADSGDDKNATATFSGAICVDIDEWKAPEDELVSSTKRAWSKVTSNGKLIYDSIGVGAHVGSTLKELEIKGNYFKFNAGAGVSNPNDDYAPKIKNGEKFENLKAQAWQDVADRLRNTYNAVNKGMKYNTSELISISSKIEKIERLKNELCIPRKSYSKRGLDMVEPKDAIKSRGFPSPNLADAFIMGACQHLVKSSEFLAFKPETSFSISALNSSFVNASISVPSANLNFAIITLLSLASHTQYGYLTIC